MSYPAHVILRYEIERALINGDIEVDDIPALWNEKMQARLDCQLWGLSQWLYAGYSLDRRRLWLLPSYTLGSMYAAQLFSAAHRALPDLNQHIAQGEFSALFDWLRQNIWQHGSRFTTEQLITQPPESRSAAAISALTRKPVICNLLP